MILTSKMYDAAIDAYGNGTGHHPSNLEDALKAALAAAPVDDWDVLEGRDVAVTATTAAPGETLPASGLGKLVSISRGNFRGVARIYLEIEL